MKDYTKVSDLAYDELVQHVRHFLQLSSDSFHEGDNEKAAWYLMVSQRYSKELSERVILTAI